MSRLDDENYRPDAAVDSESNELLQTPLEPTRTNGIAHGFFHESREKHDVDDTVFHVDGVVPLKEACQQHGLDFGYEPAGNRNSAGSVFREVKRQISSFPNCFRHARKETADEWSRALAFAWNQRI